MPRGGSKRPGDRSHCRGLQEHRCDRRRRALTIKTAVAGSVASWRLTPYVASFHPRYCGLACGRSQGLSGGAFGGDVDYAQLVTLRPEGGVSSDKRYSPAECTGIRKRRVEGNPDLAHVSTSCRAQQPHHAMSMRRFTRLTNAFSKKIENHTHSVALHFMYYNAFSRPPMLAYRRGATLVLIAGMQITHCLLVCDFPLRRPSRR